MNPGPAQTPQTPPGALSVFMDQVHVGSLHNGDPLSFSYDAAWLDNPEAQAIDPQIPLCSGGIATPHVHAFFENLLPEGDQRKLISLRHHVSSIFGMLAVVGGDTAGAFVLHLDGTLHRLWQADFCQLSGIASDRKYETDGGPSFKDYFDLLGVHSAQPAVDQRNLLRWLFFNLAVGNNDSHAKNLAILHTAGGMRLAPFYDLMSTRVYAGLGAHFAFSIDSQFDPAKITASHVRDLAASSGITPRYVKKIAGDMVDQVLLAIPAAVQEILPALGHAENVMAERLQFEILHIAKQMRQRLENNILPSSIL
jgi:HipA-like protein